MSKRRTEKIVGFIFWVLATALFLTAMFTDRWVNTPIFNFGLFDYCFEGPLQPCGKFAWWYSPESPYIFLHVFIPRMLLFCGAALVALGIIIGILDICNTAACPIRTEGVLDIMGGLAILLGCTIFTAKNFDRENIVSVAGELRPVYGLLKSLPLGDGENFNFSFYFGWTSGLLYLIAGVCYVIAGSRR